MRPAEGDPADPSLVGGGPGRAARTCRGLLISGTNRTLFEAVASPTEHVLAAKGPGVDSSHDLDDAGYSPSGHQPLPVFPCSRLGIG